MGCVMCVETGLLCSLYAQDSESGSCCTSIQEGSHPCRSYVLGFWVMYLGFGRACESALVMLVEGFCTLEYISCDDVVLLLALEA